MSQYSNNADLERLTKLRKRLEICKEVNTNPVEVEIKDLEWLLGIAAPVVEMQNERAYIMVRSGGVVKKSYLDEVLDLAGMPKLGEEIESTGYTDPRGRPYVK